MAATSTDSYAREHFDFQVPQPVPMQKPLGLPTAYRPRRPPAPVVPQEATVGLACLAIRTLAKYKCSVSDVLCAVTAEAARTCEAGVDVASNPDATCFFRPFRRPELDSAACS